MTRFYQGGKSFGVPWRSRPNPYYAWLVLTASALSGCAPNVDSRLLRPEGSLAPIRCVAVLTFDNLTRYPYAGQIAAEVLGVEILHSRAFNVMERSEAERIFMTRGIIPPQSMDESFAAEAGKVLGVDGIFIGTVSEYYYRKAGGTAQEEEPVVGMTIRLIEVPTSQILWTGTITKVSGSMFLGMREPINEVALLAVEEVLSPLLAAVPERSVDPRNICWSDPRNLLLISSGPPVQSPGPPPPPPNPAATSPPSGTGGTAPQRAAEVAVMNGSGVPKAGENIAKILLLGDVNLASVGNAPKTNLRKTTVYYKKGFRGQAEKISGLLPGNPVTEESSAYTWDVTVVVGKDLAGR